DGESRMRMAIALHQYWLRRGLIAEGRGWLEGDLLRNTQCSTRIRVDALNASARLLFQAGEYELAKRHSEESLHLATEQNWVGDVARTLNNLGMVAHVRGDLSEAQTRFEEFLSLCKQAGNPRRIAAGLTNLATVMFDQQE